MFLILVSNDICGFCLLFLFFFPFFGSVLSSVVQPRPYSHLCAVCPLHPLTHPQALGSLVCWAGTGPASRCPPSLFSLPGSSVPSGGNASPRAPPGAPSLSAPRPPTAPSLLCFAC